MPLRTEQAIDRIEREIATLTRKLDQVNGRLDRTDENSYEYGQLGRESSALARKLTSLYADVEELEGQL